MREKHTTGCRNKFRMQENLNLALNSKLEISFQKIRQIERRFTALLDRM